MIRWESPRCAVANVLDCDIDVSEFEHHLHFYFHFQKGMTLRKIYNI